MLFRSFSFCQGFRLWINNPVSSAKLCLLDVQRSFRRYQPKRKTDIQRPDQRQRLWVYGSGIQLHVLWRSKQLRHSNANDIRSDNNACICQ